MLNNEQKRLFNQAFDEYRKLVRYVSSNNSSVEIDNLNKKISHHALLDAELVHYLMDICSCDARAPTSAEQEFVLSLLEAKDELKKNVPGYLKFFRNMNPDTFNIINDTPYSLKNHTPIPLKVSIERDNKSTQIEIIKGYQTIFNSFSRISDINIDVKNQKIENILSSMSGDVGITWNESKFTGESINPQVSGNLDDYMDELSVLVGLGSVKTELRQMVNYLRVSELRKKQGMPQVTITKHMVFTGNPGTGKTTVARILAGIYKKLGILSGGQLVEVDRSGLVGAYIGQTEEKTKEVIQSAIGGILFIDEAYALFKEDSDRDYGKEAISTLLKAMEDNRDNLVVIVAGYPNLMDKFINSNPGLRSRFTHFIQFPDYSVEEKQEIFNGLASRDGYYISQGAVSKLSELWKASELNPNFGNGRGVRNVFEKVVTRQSTRIISIETPTKEDLMTITEEDIPNIPKNPVSHDELNYFM